MAADLISLQESADKPLSLVGGKASALGRLISFGAPVPKGFVLTTRADLKTTHDQILVAFDAMETQFVAVRSSAAGEDSQGQSWAGQFESYLYVARANLLDRIADCRASGDSSRAKAYDASKSHMAVAVIVQEMISSDVAGVLFTANPITKNRNEIMIEAVYGLGEQLVQGLATPDNFILDKSSGQVISQSIAEKTDMLVGSKSGIIERSVEQVRRAVPALNPRQLTQLARMSADLETKFDVPLDIEWAYAQDKLYIVQARPITTL